MLHSINFLSVQYCWHIILIGVFLRAVHQCLWAIYLCWQIHTLSDRLKYKNCHIFYGIRLNDAHTSYIYKKKPFGISHIVLLIFRNPMSAVYVNFSIAIRLLFVLFPIVGVSFPYTLIHAFTICTTIIITINQSYDATNKSK